MRYWKRKSNWNVRNQVCEVENLTSAGRLSVQELTNTSETWRRKINKLGRTEVDEKQKSFWVVPHYTGGWSDKSGQRERSCELAWPGKLRVTLSLQKVKTFSATELGTNIESTASIQNVTQGIAEAVRCWLLIAVSRVQSHVIFCDQNDIGAGLTTDFTNFPLVIIILPLLCPHLPCFPCTNFLLQKIFIFHWNNIVWNIYLFAVYGSANNNLPWPDGELLHSR
jgi:hypothetical protein